jgi:hypothetical protein
MRKRSRTARFVLAIPLFTATAYESCLTNDVAQRFRAGYAPGFVEGLTQAVSKPGDWEAGLRRSWAAIFEGLGALIQPQPKSASTSGS